MYKGKHMACSLQTQQRHEHDVDLTFAVNLGSQNLQFVQMSDHLQNMIPDWGSLCHICIEEGPHSHLPTCTILFPKHLFEVHHHVISSGYVLMLVL